MSFRLIQKRFPKPPFLDAMCAFTLLRMQFVYIVVHLYVYNFFGECFLYNALAIMKSMIDS